MLKNFGFLASTINALRLEAQTQVSWALNSKSWEDNSAFVDTQIASGVKFEDSQFLPNNNSLGKVSGDAAQGLNNISTDGITWKRVSEIFSADVLEFFSQGETPFSTMQQGTLGDCYLLATLCALDSRPGALEDLFYTKTIN